LHYNNIEVSILLIKNLFIFVLVACLSACGGSGGGTPTTKTPDSVTPTPVACVSEQYTISGATDDGTHNTDQGPENSIDNDTDTASRWSSEGVGKEIIFDLGEVKPLSALQLLWFKGDERTTSFSIETSTDNSTWTNKIANQTSSGVSTDFEVVNLNESVDTRYIKLIGLGNSDSEWNSLIEAQAFKCELDEPVLPQPPTEPTIPDAPLPDLAGTVILPSATGIDLLDWYLSIPVDEGDGYSDSIGENELSNGYIHNDFFYGIEESDGDKGIVMMSPARGYRTSENTYYVRVELREMLRRGGSGSTQGVNNNNWVFSSAPTASQNAAGGVDGELNVTLAINHVTSTFGEDYSQLKEADKTKTPNQFEYQVGRVVIGQIHANSDEPIRLYYRKLPEHSKGSIYFYHEGRDTNGDGEKPDEVLVNILGNKNLSIGDAEPSDGIALNEKFSYSINVTGNDLTVTISRDGKGDVVGSLDMSISGEGGGSSGYDEADQYQYFKVGLYHLNNTAADDDYVQGTFYEIRNSHIGYADSE
jgi:poly(beta-D-mannuronate) lyase